MCLPNMLKALEFIPSTEEKIKRQQEKKRKEEGKGRMGRVWQQVLGRPRRGREAFWTRLSQTARHAYKTKE